MKKKLFLLVTLITVGILGLVGSIFLFSNHLNRTVHVDLGETKKFLTMMSLATSRTLELEKTVTMLFASGRAVEVDQIFEQIQTDLTQTSAAFADLKRSKWESISASKLNWDKQEVTVESLLENAIEQFGPTEKLVQATSQARKNQVRNLEALETKRKSLSKIYRDSGALLKNNPDVSQKMSRAVLTVLSSSSLKDIAYAGRAIFSDVQKHFEKAKLSGEQAKLWKELESEFFAARNLATDAFAASGDFPILMNEFKQLREKLTALSHFSNESFDANSHGLGQLTSKLGYLNIGMGIILLVCCFWSFFVVVQVVRQTTTSTSDLIGLKSKINTSALSTSEVGQKLKVASDQQAAAVNSSLSSIEEMAASLEQTSKSASDAARTGKHAQVIAKESESSMRDLERAMVELSQKAQLLEGILTSFRQVEEKIGLINEIVMKTQILSFNASIEAERAGEHGRGFSVVAEEVGALSRTSGMAADEINRILKSAQLNVSETVEQLRDRVEMGQKATKTSISAFGEIQKAIKDLEIQITQIATTAESQYKTVEEFRHGFESTQMLAISNQSLASDLQESSKHLEVGAFELGSTLDTLSQVVHGSQQPDSTDRSVEDRFAA